MAGKPITRARFATLTKLEDEIMARLADGEFVTHICKELEMGSTTFYEWLNSKPERRERFDRVRELSAHSHAEKSFDVLEEARKEGRELTAAQSAIARSQADSHRWLAGKFNDLYSDKVRMEADAESFADAFISTMIAAQEQAQERQDETLETVEEAEYELLDEAAEEGSAASFAPTEQGAEDES